MKRARVETRVKRMAELVRRVRADDWAGWSGEPVRDVVNIGIGGSHLGPVFATEALGHLHDDGTRCHFVSNVDPRDLEVTLAGLAPSRTLFIVASKTFSTLETLENARSARRWLQAAGCPETALDRMNVKVHDVISSLIGVSGLKMVRLWVVP